MAINKRQLKAVDHDFCSVSSRLLNTDFQDYERNLSKFLQFVRETDVVWDYVRSCVNSYPIESEQLAAGVRQVVDSYGGHYFNLEGSDEQETATIFQTLEYISSSGINVPRTIGMSYAGGSKNFQDMSDNFNRRYVNVLVSHIEDYLTRIGVQMGFDDTQKYSIVVNGGAVQLNIANGESSIDASMSLGASIESSIAKLRELEAASRDLEGEEAESASSGISDIKEELSKESPDKGKILSALEKLKGITSAIEFAVAVGELSVLLAPILANMA